MYSEVIPTLEMIEKMLKNEQDRETLCKFVDTTFPTIKMTVLANDILGCTGCDLYACNHTVFKGDIDSRIMILGDNPTEQEEKTGIPFSGPASTIFNNMLAAAEESINERWKRERVFLSYLVKCKPINDKGMLRNPDIKEIASCKKHIDREIELVNPDIIIVLGSIAAKTLIYPDFDLTKEHGKIFDHKDRKIMAMYSPSYVMMLGEQTPEGIQRKTEMWQDLLSANEYLDSLNK